jgi:hypothetical protein
MINIEYEKAELAGAKRPSSQWVETDNKNLQLMDLIFEKNPDDSHKMQVEK